MAQTCSACKRRFRPGEAVQKYQMSYGYGERHSQCPPKTEQWCGSCEQSYPATEAYFYSRSGNGAKRLLVPCKACRRKQQAARRAARPPRIREILAEPVKPLPHTRDLLTEQQWRVLDAIIPTGASNRRAAEELGLSVYTVRSHLAEIRKALLPYFDFDLDRTSNRWLLAVAYSYGQLKRTLRHQAA